MDSLLSFCNSPKVFRTNFFSRLSVVAVQTQPYLLHSLVILARCWRPVGGDLLLSQLSNRCSGSSGTLSLMASRSVIRYQEKGREGRARVLCLVFGEGILRDGWCLARLSKSLRDHIEAHDALFAGYWLRPPRHPCYVLIR